MVEPAAQGDSTRGGGKSLYWAAVVALLLGMTALYQAVLRNDAGPGLHVDGAGNVMVVLQRQSNGHFLAEGSINGRPVRFLVDTGATDVAISESVARALGLDFGPRQTIMTAGGPVTGWATRLDSVQVGAFVLSNVRASISPGLGDEALLGMSFLRHFSMIQEGETLVLTPAGMDRT